MPAFAWTRCILAPSRVDVLSFSQGKGQSLQTAKDYGDFELLVGWKNIYIRTLD